MDDDKDSVNLLANALLAKEEEDKTNEIPTEEDKGEEQAKSDTQDKDKDEKVAEDDSKSEDKGDDKPEGDDKSEEKPAEKPSDNDTKPDDKSGEDKPATDEKVEDKTAEEDTKPLTKEEIKEVLREEAEERAKISSERASFAGQVRADLKEALKLDSTHTTVALEDGTPVTSVSQLTQVINPETDEPYTREEAATLLLEAKQIVEQNVAQYEKRVDELTDLNVDFKEQADEVDRLYGSVLKAFPEEAKEWLAAYRKTFKTSEDGSYVTDVPISPLEFYGPIVKPFLNASAQVEQQQAEEAAAAEKAAKEAEIKAEQEDRGDLGGTAGSAQGKPNILADALEKYAKDN